MARALPDISVTHASFTSGICGIGSPAGRMPTVRTAAEPSAPGWDQPKATVTPAATLRAKSMSTRGKWNFRTTLRRTEHQGRRAKAEHDRVRVDRSPVTDGQPQAIQDVLMAAASFDQTEQIADLAQCNQKAGPGHETDHNGIGNVSRPVAQFENGDQNLDRADHHRQNEGGLGTCFSREPGPRKANELKTTSEMALVGPLIRQRGRAENRGDDGDDNGRVEAVSEVRLPRSEHRPSLEARRWPLPSTRRRRSLRTSCHAYVPAMGVRLRGSINSLAESFGRRMQTALGLGGPAPAAGAFILARRHRPRAWPAADAGIALVVQRIVRDVSATIRAHTSFLVHGQGADFHQAELLVPLHNRGIGPRRTLIAANAGGPGLETAPPRGGAREPSDRDSIDRDRC